MAQPVWVLSVDLQTKTATFQSGLADAARSARSAFQDIGSSAKTGMGGVVEGTTDVRHSLGLMDNAIRGNHAAAMVDMIRLFQSSSVVMNLLPFAGVIGGFLLLGGTVVEVVQKIRQMREEQEKLQDLMTNEGTTINGVFNGLDEKLLQAEKRSDELRNDHLAALQKQLQLIDMQSMDDLIHSFETVAKTADEVFKRFGGHWYTFGIGAHGAAHALEEFQVQYKSLLSQGKYKEASDLLKGTRDSAQEVLNAQRAMINSRQSGGFFGPSVDYVAQYKALLVLQQAGVGYEEDDVRRQVALLHVLNAQLGVTSRVAELKKQDSGNATRSTGNEMAAQRSAAARESAESQLRMGESAIAGEKATAEAQLTIHRGSIEQRLALDLDFANREYSLQSAANQAEIAALDKSGKDYQNQLQALQDKALEQTQQHETQVAQLKAKASEEESTRDIQAVEQAIREQVEATQQGSAARLAAIDAGIREEQARQLQDTSFYRDLMNQRVEVTRQAAEQEAKLKADAAREDASNAGKMGQLHIDAEKQRMATQNSGQRPNAQRQVEQATKIANEEYNVKMAALAKETEGLDKSGKDYQNKLKQLQDQEKQLTQEHENELAAIKDKAIQESNQQVLSGVEKLDDSIARGMTQSIMGRQSWAKTFISLGDEVVSGMMQNAIKSMLALDLDKEKQAAAAARAAFVNGEKMGGPAGFILGPLLAVQAFAGVMAFAGGTDSVPGVGKGDVVPAMLTPGEGIVPGGVMDGLRNMARNGGFDQGPRYHVTTHVHMNASALDSDGMDRVLSKHADTLQRHFEHTLRRMNR